MPEGEEASLTSLWLPSAQRKLLVTGVLATVLTMAEMYNGSVTRVLRYIKRYSVLYDQPVHYWPCARGTQWALERENAFSWNTKMKQ